VRIASLLDARELPSNQHHTEPRNDGPTDYGSTIVSLDGQGSSVEHRHQTHKKRKHNVIIHSSPFLRCIQTSTAIAAGLGQFHGICNSTPEKSILSSQSHHTNQSNRNHHKHAYSLGSGVIPGPDVEHRDSLQRPVQKGSGIPKVRLRLDAFLGEWLNPDYYEYITPPPGSLMMIASAKADLLRPGEPVHTAEDSSSATPKLGHFPGGWGSTGRNTSGPLSSMKSLADALSRDRSSSYSVAETLGSINGNSVARGYIPPVPSYAISPSEPIPPGYVAHARDACVEVDYQWDSMRPPQDWGTGGEYGEEWSSMHKRFRKGLHRMISWYHQQPESRDNTNGHTKSPDTLNGHEDDETDTVLILVTHGAGCNALIGALTNQPVLLDVPMASLTMAVRKYEENIPSDLFMASMVKGRRASADTNSDVSYEYDLRLVASTDHLRTGSVQLASAVPSRIQTSTPSFVPQPRGRFRSTTITDAIYESPSETLFKLPGFRTHKSLQRSTTSHPDGPNPGLWSKPGSSTAPSKELPEMEFAIGGDVSDEDEIGPLQVVANGKSAQAGLWGASPIDIASERDSGMKRRWTMSEHHVSNETTI
jgi:broad specificity phosphatase PhoE